MAASRLNKPHKKSRLFRWTGYLLATVLLLVSIILLLFYGLLYSETGSRWALVKAQDYLPLSIQQSSGRLAKEVTALDLEYQQAGMVIKIDKMSYRIADIDWWQRHLVFDYIRIGEISVELPANESEPEALSEAIDIELPLSIELNELFVQNIQVNSEQSGYGPIWAKAAVKDNVIEIDTLQLLDEEIRLKVAGQVTLNSHWPFELSTKWSYKPEQISGEGNVTGDITGLALTQTTQLDNAYAQGDTLIESTLTFYPAFVVNAQISSDRLLIPLANNEQVTTAFTDLIITAEGMPENYQIQIKANTEQSIKPLIIASEHAEQKSAQSVYRNQINLTAQGDTEQLNVDSFAIEGDFGRLRAQSTLTFSPRFSVTSSFDSESFNPQWLLPEWPGKLSGSGQFKATQTDQDSWQLALNDFTMQGQLKNNDLKITANADFHDQLLDLKPLSLLWGENSIKLEGQLSLAEEATSKQMVFDLNIPKPGLFLPELTGEIHGEGQLAGSLQALDYKLTVTAEKIDYQDQQIKALTIKGSGQWPDQLQAEITASEVITANQAFPKVHFSLNGSRQQHEIKGDIKHQDLTTQITLAGGWFDAQQQWRGQILKHDIQLNDSDMHWQLQAATDIVMGQQIHLSPACWYSLNGDGEACVELDVQTQKGLIVAAKVQLKNLQAALLQSLLPQDLKLEGMIQGTADLSYQQQALSLTADLKTEQASIDYLKGQENSYQVAINKATLTARQEAGVTEINTNIELDDDSFLHATATLNDTVNSSWPEVNADIDGVIKHSRFLVALSPELEQLQGEFSVSGQVKGALNQPSVRFELQQQTGFLILRQTGSRLTNIALQVSSLEPGLISLQASADSDKGSIQSTGELDLLKTDAWSYQGQITGTDFRLLTLPELKVNIDPTLNIKASPQAINITGKLLLPMAEVNIKNLPPSATTTSADVVIHRPEQALQKSSASIPLHYDVVTEIKDPISIQLMGLQAKMAGQLRVYDVRRQTFAEGRLNLTEGFYKLYGQRLNIERGELIFNGPINNPAIDVKAVRKSDDGTVTAGILLTGTVNQLQSTLYSEPAMSQLEVLSYLATGRGLNEGAGTDGEQLAQAAILLGLKRSDSVFSQLQNAFGIDVLTIKQGANNENSYIEAGQNISDALYVGYSQGLFNRLGFWILRYKINDALRLETTQGENQTVDIIYVRRKK